MTSQEDNLDEMVQRHVNVTRSIEHHNYKTNEECAQACERILGREHPLVKYFKYYA